MTWAEFEAAITSYKYKQPQWQPNVESTLPLDYQILKARPYGIGNKSSFAQGA